MCDMAAASIPKIAAWCRAQGGTWVLVGGGEQECQNLPAQYPGIGQAILKGPRIRRRIPGFERERRLHNESNG